MAVAALLPRSFRDAAGPFGSLSCGFVFVPIPLAWLWRATNHAGWVLAVLLVVSYGLLMLRASRGESRASASAAARAPWPLWLLAAWVGGCVFLALWLPTAFDRVVVQSAHDYVKHHAVLWSLANSPLPLHSPFYAAEPDISYYYYEYHYYIAAAMRQLAGQTSVSIALAFAASSALLAVTLVGLTHRLALVLLGTPRAALFAAACISVLGGWDILPAAWRMFETGRPLVTLDTWIAVPWRLHNLATQLIWCPQHVAALLALVFAALLLHVAPRARAWLWVAPLTASFCFGTSAYLTLVYFAASCVLILWALRDGPEAPPFGSRPRFLSALLLMGAASLALTIVQMQQYREMSARFPGGLTVAWERGAHALLGRWLAPGPFANLLDAPWLLLLDLGLPGLALLLVNGAFWGRLSASPAARLLLPAALLGALASVTIRSNIHSFDYSFRIAIMPAQLLGALCAGALLDAGNVRAWARSLGLPALTMGVALSAPCGLYELPLMAVRSFLPPDAGECRVEAAAIRYVRGHTAPDAVLQAGPEFSVVLPQLCERAVSVARPDDAHVQVFTPPNRDEMLRKSALAAQAFRSESSREAHAALHELRVTHVLRGPREMAAFGAMRALEDEKYFERVFTDEQVWVLRVGEGIAVASELPQSMAMTPIAEEP
jgi:hypothetical protein